jgi:uncharacterized protein with HEPN domain
VINARAAKLLWDAQDAARSIVEFTAGKQEADYAASKLLRSAVERQFEILGEALGALRRKSPDVADRIPDIANLVALRNILAHEYDRVRTDAIWRTINVDLPGLLVTLDQLLSEAEPP